METRQQTEAEIFISHQNHEKLEREDEIYTTVLNEKCPECSNYIELYNMSKFNKAHYITPQADYTLICKACSYCRDLN